jgi:hypothetical protein
VPVSAEAAREQKISRGAAVGRRSTWAEDQVAGPMSAEDAARGLESSRGAAVGTSSTWAEVLSRARGAVVPAVPKKRRSQGS